jgi:alpha-ribazole phosphatase
VTTLFAARHAAVSVEGICYGQSDVPTRLDDAAAGDLLVTTIEALAPRIQRVWASPWQRTRGPAQHVCARLGLPLVIDARLSELSFGAWEGRRYAELERESEFQRWMADWQSAAPPRGETVAELLARVAAWRTEVLGRGEVALAISHAGVIRALRAQAQAVPYASLMGDAVEPLAVEAIWRQ